MARPIKVFSGVVRLSGRTMSGRLDGQTREHTALIATTSQRKAAEIAAVPLSEIRGYWSVASPARQESMKQRAEQASDPYKPAGPRHQVTGYTKAVLLVREYPEMMLIMDGHYKAPLALCKTYWQLVMKKYWLEHNPNLFEDAKDPTWGERNW